MTINGAIWFMIGGVVGAVLGCVAAYGMAFARDYTEKVDYYDLDPVEINTPTYAEMMEYETYDELF